VIGRNGSGKSTILNAIAGTFLPDIGTIRIGGPT
jgi:putative ABC transport system ATP-binding protein